MDDKMRVYVVIESERYKYGGKEHHAYNISKRGFISKKKALSYACKLANIRSKIYEVKDDGSWDKVPFNEKGYYHFKNPSYKYFEYYCINMEERYVSKEQINEKEKEKEL